MEGSIIAIISDERMARKVIKEILNEKADLMSNHRFEAIEQGRLVHEKFRCCPLINECLQQESPRR